MASTRESPQHLAKNQYPPGHLPRLHVVEGPGQLLQAVTPGDQIVELKFPGPIKLHQPGQVEMWADRTHKRTQQSLVL